MMDSHIVFKSNNIYDVLGFLTLSSGLVGTWLAGIMTLLIIGLFFRKSELIEKGPTGPLAREVTL